MLCCYTSYTPILSSKHEGDFKAVDCCACVKVIERLTGVHGSTPCAMLHAVLANNVLVDKNAGFRFAASQVLGGGHRK